MNNSITQIQLLGDNEGLLDISDNVVVPINLSVGDIRDISKRSGIFSKTIVLPGTANNNQLLNSYYDVNVAAGTFDINKIQRCILLQDGVAVVNNAYLQLVAVNKSQDTINHDQLVSYEVVIKDGVGDFFTQLGNRTLEGRNEAGIPYIDLSQYNHSLTAAAVTESFTHTEVDGYKYLIPWVDDTQLFVNECKPAIYAKQYWDRIHTSTGFTYQWDTLNDVDVQFDKLLIPYNGDDQKVSQEIVDQAAVVIRRGVLGDLITQADAEWGGTIYGYNTIVDQGRMEIPPVVDNNGAWTQHFQYTGPGQYLNQADLVGTNVGISVQVTGEYSFEIANSSPTEDFRIGNPWPEGNGQGAKPFISFTKNLGGTDVAEFRVSLDQPTLFPDQNYPANSTTTTVAFTPFAASGFLTPMEISSTLTIGSGVQFAQPGFGVEFNTQFNWTAEPSTRLIIRNLEVKLSPVSNTISYNFPVNLNAFIPKQVKQADFIKSICLMYNLFVEADPNDERNLIYKHRDDFYDSGVLKDWTHKLDKASEQKLNFLPEITNKKLLLTYKESDDLYNKLYLGSTSEVYGQQEVIFQNEYVRGEAKKELIFSPTPMQPSAFNAILPLIPGISPKTNIRILLDGGMKTCGSYEIVNHLGTGTVPANIITTNKYPLISHLNSEYDPTLDINFGMCDFYFYNLGLPTANNLFNRYWRRTVAQLDQGKLLTAYFALSGQDIATTKLNDKIRIDNSWWNINKIVDYDANSNNLTKVELLSVDPDLTLPRVVKTGPITFSSGDQVNGGTLGPGVVGPNPITPTHVASDVKAINNTTTIIRDTQVNTWQNSGNGLVIGTGNTIGSGFQGIVIGNGQTIPGGTGLYINGTLFNSNGITYAVGSSGASGYIDGGKNTVLPLSKINESDVIEGGKDVVRLFGGGVAGGYIIDPGTTAPIVIQA